MNAIVASKPTEQAEEDLTVLAAQEQRLPQLQKEVAAGAWCASTGPEIPAPDDWFRRDGEPAYPWLRRRKQLVAACGACPVRAACEESALRQGDGVHPVGADMVRGGRTAMELHRARTKQASRLAAAVAEDERSARRARPRWSAAAPAA